MLLLSCFFHMLYFHCVLSNSPYNIDYEVSECHCVPRDMCQDNDAAINGDGLLNIRVESGTCDNYFDVCCENPAPQKTTINHVIPKTCGTQTPMQMDLRITGDANTAQFGELPWTVALLLKEALEVTLYLYKCGGSLIHHQVAITAAHCVAGEMGLMVIRAGEWNTLSKDEPLPHQDRIVKEVTMHPNFHQGTLQNDIALLFLQEPVELASNVGLICLPPVGLKLHYQGCVAGGWGKNAFRRGKSSTVLKMIRLPLVDRLACQMALRNTRLGKFYQLHRSFICAGGQKNKDTCKGDGGSPLVCISSKNNNQFVQVGIVSWGIGCGESDTPGVYVNVALYRNWIDKQLSVRNFDVTVYEY